MSIVIVGVENNRSFYIAADKRRMVGENVYDDFTKILKLSPTLYLGITGIAEEGAAILKETIDIQFNYYDDLMSHLDNKFTPRMNELTITLAGRRSSGDYFLWAKNNKGEVSKQESTPTNTIFSIASPNDQQFVPFFKKAYASGRGLKGSIIETIEYASTIEDSISKTYDIYTI